MATNQTNAVEAMLQGVSILHDIGLDSEGRSHHYDPKNHEIVVCTDDKRGIAFNNDDEEQRIEPSPHTTGVWDYIQFVRDEVDDLEWQEIDAPEEPPQ